MEFSILGPLEVRRDGQLLALGGAKQRALLAILVINANRAVSVEQLGELLWPDEAPADPGHVIEVYVSQLRRALEPDGAPYRILVRKPAGYLINIPRDELDATRFEGLVESAANLGPEQAAAQLTRALGLWHGPALREFATDSFGLAEASRLDELRLHAIELRVDAELALGRHAGLIPELGALVHEHPLRERMCGQLMLALYRSGRQAEASDVYQRTRSRLVEDLGMEPGPELQSLLKRILQQDPALDQPSPAAPAGSQLPAGTVTFLLTDIERSTHRWESHPESMRAALEMHDAIVDHRLAEYGGTKVESGREGDSVLAAFTRASDAVSAAAAIQRDFARQPWPEDADLHVRIALHSGEAELRAGHYYGRSVYRCARLLAVGHGDQILVSRATHDLVIDGLPDGVTLRDLGSHRLRDLERPEVVYQVIATGLQSEFPSLNSLDPGRNNLPISMTTFVGREADMTSLKARARSWRLVTVTGSAGTGKTRLALQVAAEMLDAYRDGVWFIELAPITDSVLVPHAVAEAVGAQEQPGESVLGTVIRSLRDKQVLLVLDNCEHLVAAVADVTTAVLRECSQVRVIATSREPLRIGGEAIVRVGPLDEVDAVQLFADRLSTSRPDFRLTPENAEPVAQICRRVEGIPLAIELAAGRGRMMTPAEILARLQDSFMLLAGGPRSVDERHQTLRAAIDWSYRLLNDEEKRVFRRLSVFKGGFTLEAAEAICHEYVAGSVLEIVGQLVDKSLVGAHEVGSGATRYLLLEAVRDYGFAKLAEEREVDETIERHAHYFLDIAEEAHPELSGPARTRWLRRISDDVDNLRAIFDSRVVDPDLQLRLAIALEEYWAARGELSEGRARLEAALPSTTEGSKGQAAILLGLGNIAIAQGEHHKAIDYCRQSLSIYRELGNPEGESDCVQLIGEALFHLEDFAGARSALNEALEIATRNGLDRVRSVCYWRLGIFDLAAKDLPGAQHHLEQSLSLGREQSDAEMVAVSLLMLGNVALWGDRPGEARPYLLESLEILGHDGKPGQVASLLDSLAAVALAAGETERALVLGGASEGLRQRSAIKPTSSLHREIRSRLEDIRQEPGGPETWTRGARLPREQAVEFALGEIKTQEVSAGST